MKTLIRKILQEQEEIITLPPIIHFDNDWNLVLEASEGKPFKILGDVFIMSNQEITTLGNCYAVGGYLNIWNCNNFKSLGNLTEVGGELYLGFTKIKSLGNLRKVNDKVKLSDNYELKTLGNLYSVGGYLNLIACQNLQSLGNLTEVGGYLDISRCQIKSLGNLKYVGSFFDVENTPIAHTMTENKIRQQVNVGGNIFFQ
jgi:hypothetical protein